MWILAGAEAAYEVCCRVAGRGAMEEQVGDLDGVAPGADSTFCVEAGAVDEALAVITALQYVIKLLTSPSSKSASLIRQFS